MPTDHSPVSPPDPPIDSSRPSPPAQLHAASALYGVESTALEPLGAFESDVYAYDGPQGPSILKVIAPEHRSVDQVRAEVDWLLALSEAGIPVAEPLPALSGAWVERLGDPEKILVAFRRAPGVLTKPADWTDEGVEAWGALLGQLQAHSRGFTPPGPRRRLLRAQAYASGFETVVPDDAGFVAGAEKLAARIAPLLEPGPDFGLIHADLHHGNLLLDDERWTAIDFDDSAYGPYVFDLAMPLYYAVRGQPGRPADEAANDFLGPFLRGFRRHAPDPAGGGAAISLCLDYRQAELVMALRLKVPAEQWDDQLRSIERELRANVAAGRELVSANVLRRWFESA